MREQQHSTRELQFDETTQLKDINRYGVLHKKSTFNTKKNHRSPQFCAKIEKANVEGVTITSTMIYYKLIFFSYHLKYAHALLHLQPLMLLLFRFVDSKRDDVGFKVPLRNGKREGRKGDLFLWSVRTPVICETRKITPSDTGNKTQEETFSKLLLCL